MLFSVLVSCLATASAFVHHLNWSIDWTIANPDGKKPRPVVGINGQWPFPVLHVSKGDRIEAYVYNNLTEPYRNSTIHFHGISQNGTNDMDGAPFVTQAPIAPGSWFLYNFTIDQAGTYWYHAHVNELYPNGYRQLLLVHDDDAWFEDQVDREVSFTLSDWYHELTETLDITKFMVPSSEGDEPVPDSNLFNDTIEPAWEVGPNETVRIRLGNIGALTSYIFYIEGEEFDIVEVDGVYTEPARAKSIYVSTAQRYSLLFNTSSDPSKVYRMVQVVDTALYDDPPPTVNLNGTGYLWQGNPAAVNFSSITQNDIYQSSGIVQKNSTNATALTSDDMEYFDDIELVPWDRQPLLPEPDHEVQIMVKAGNLDNGINYYFLNNITMTHAKVPTLFSVLTAPDDSTAQNASIYGHDTHPIVLNHNEVVQFVVNNNDDDPHPFHLHGHQFQCVKRGPEQEEFTPYDPNSGNKLPVSPMRRDTFVVKGYSYIVIRFRADNPGVWLFHCHVDWHLAQGMALEVIEAPLQLRQNKKVHPVPEFNIAAEKASNVSLSGNAAGKNGTDLSGQNAQPAGTPISS